MNHGAYKFADLTLESRRLGSFGRPRPWGRPLDYTVPVPDELIIVNPTGIPPPAVSRYRHSAVISLPDPDFFLVLEWTTGDRDDDQPELMHVRW